MSQSETRDVLAQARTLLAAERTFSAWIRTGLAGIGGGLAIARLIPFRTVVNQNIAYIAGQILIVWGAAVFIFALWGYWRTYKELGLDGLSKGRLLMLSIITFAMFVVAALVMWIVFQTALAR